MPPRRRKSENSDLPENLYTTTDNGVTFFVFEHPITHKRAGMGSDRERAIKNAVMMNSALAQAGITKQKAKPAGGNRIRSIIAKWEPHALNGLAEKSQKNARNWISVINESIGDDTANSVTTKDLYEFVSKHPPSSQKRLKSFLVRLFDFAISVGARHDANPATALHIDKQDPVQRRRLTLDQYRAIYGQAEPWMQSAMTLMIQTTLRPGDVLRLRFDQVVGDRLHCTVRKTQKNLSIRLNSAALEAIATQRQSGLLCPYIIHRKPLRRRHRKECDHLFQVVVDYWSDEFSRIRDKLGMHADLPARVRPSLYEIRALSAHLYDQQGADRKSVQALMAHTSEEMTRRYQERHAAKYIEVDSGLVL